MDAVATIRSAATRCWCIRMRSRDLRLAGHVRGSVALRQGLALSRALLTVSRYSCCCIWRRRFSARCRDWNSDVWVGAAVTSLLFAVGKVLIGLYIGKASVASSYGAAGALAVLLVWVYYSSQVFLLGAEFTCAYAQSHGSRRAHLGNRHP